MRKHLQIHKIIRKETTFHTTEGFFYYLFWSSVLVYSLEFSGFYLHSETFLKVNVWGLGSNSFLYFSSSASCCLEEMWSAIRQKVMSSTVLFAADYLPSNVFFWLGRNQLIWSPGPWQALRRSCMVLGRTRAPQTLPDANSEDLKMVQKSLNVSQNGHWYQRCSVSFRGLAMHWRARCWITHSSATGFQEEAFSSSIYALKQGPGPIPSEAISTEFH